MTGFAPGPVSLHNYFFLPALFNGNPGNIDLGKTGRDSMAFRHS
jgi:hypothetical protein